MPHLRRRQRGFLGGRINRESLKTSQSGPGRVTLFFLYRSNRKYATQAQPFPIDTELEISPLHQRFLSTSDGVMPNSFLKESRKWPMLLKPAIMAASVTLYFPLRSNAMVRCSFACVHTHSPSFPSVPSPCGRAWNGSWPSCR